MGEKIDEISDFQSGKWLCAPEAMWRIYGFKLHEMYPPVLQLQVHEPNQHKVCFSPYKTINHILSSEALAKTQLTEFLAMNTTNGYARSKNLLYKEFPEHFVWQKTKKEWKRRATKHTIGRIVTVSPFDSERHYLRLLLNHVRAPTSFNFLKTCNDESFTTFREVAFAKGLLEADGDIINTIEEASTFEMPYILRRLFSTLLIYNSPANPTDLWDKFKDILSDDLLRSSNSSKRLAYELCLQSIDCFLRSMGHSLSEYNLFPDGFNCSEIYASGREYENEISFTVSQHDLASVEYLNGKQRAAFDQILLSCNNNVGGVFFVDGPGGTGKTLLYKAILAVVRAKDQIALAVASSGVAASLLPNGRTAHSRFKLPIFEDDTMTCQISKQSTYEKLIIETKIIIWDEASMVHRRAFEALDLLLRDLMEKDEIFGGKTVVFGGDFRQTLPIVQGGSRADYIAASLVCSNLWHSVRKLRLTENMRTREDPVFMEFLLRIGDGIEPFVHDDYVNLPSRMCIRSHLSPDALQDLTDEIFPSFEKYKDDPLSIINRAILTPRNEDMIHINESLINKFPGHLVEYISLDLAEDPTQQCHYQDYLNDLCLSGLPPHILRLKEDSPIILLRNINPSEGLCNGTRLICKTLGKRVIGAVIATGEHIGKYVLIPCIPLQPSNDHKFSIPFRRHQFPVQLCFSMSINKAQGQTLDMVGIYLPQPVFAHGQLYVALSRAKKSYDVRVLIRPPTADCAINCENKNIVYKEVFYDME